MSSSRQHPPLPVSPPRLIRSIDTNPALVSVADFWDWTARYLLNEQDLKSDPFASPMYWVRPAYSAKLCGWEQFTLLYGPMPERNARALELTHLLAEFVGAASERKCLVKEMKTQPRWHNHVEPTGFFYMTECPYICEGYVSSKSGTTNGLPPSKQSSGATINERSVAHGKLLQYCRQVSFSDLHSVAFANLCWLLWSLDMLPVFNTRTRSPFLFDPRADIEQQNYYIMRARNPGLVARGVLPLLFPSFANCARRSCGNLAPMMASVDLDVLDGKLRSPEFLQILRRVNASSLLFGGEKIETIAQRAITNLQYVCGTASVMSLITKQVLFDPPTHFVPAIKAWNQVLIDFGPWEETFIVGPLGIGGNNNNSLRKRKEPGSRVSAPPPPKRQRSRVIEEEDDDDEKNVMVVPPLPAPSIAFDPIVLLPTPAPSPKDDDDTRLFDTGLTPEQSASLLFLDETIASAEKFSIVDNDYMVMGLPGDAPYHHDDDSALFIDTHAKEAREVNRHRRSVM